MGSIVGNLGVANHFSEFGDPLDTQAGVLTPAQRKAAALANLGLGSQSSSSTGTVTYTGLALVLTGAGANVDGFVARASTEVALGNYANAFNGKLDFGTAGRVTGLGAPVCSELDLGPGTTQGSYAVYEAELNVPAGASLGTRTSFFSLNVWGADVATFDTGGHLFDLNGVTASAGKMFSASGSIGAVNEITAGLRVLINGVAYRILMATDADFSD